jgi:hypothetical protein
MIIIRQLLTSTHKMQINKAFHEYANLHKSSFSIIIFIHY